MATLANESCIPCRGGVEPLGRAEAEALLADVPGWVLVGDGKAIARQWTFKNFREAQAFVNKTGEIAEGQGHHPDIRFGWGYAEISIHTHAIKGLHRNDFILAAKINALIA